MFPLLLAFVTTLYIGMRIVLVLGGSDTRRKWEDSRNTVGRDPKQTPEWDTVGRNGRVRPSRSLDGLEQSVAAASAVASRPGTRSASTFAGLRGRQASMPAVYPLLTSCSHPRCDQTHCQQGQRPGPPANRLQTGPNGKAGRVIIRVSWGARLARVGSSRGARGARGRLALKLPPRSSAPKPP